MTSNGPGGSRNRNSKDLLAKMIQGIESDLTTGPSTTGAPVSSSGSTRDTYSSSGSRTGAGFTSAPSATTTMKPIASTSSYSSIPVAQAKPSTPLEPAFRVHPPAGHPATTSQRQVKPPGLAETGAGAGARTTVPRPTGLPPIPGVKQVTGDDESDSGSEEGDEGLRRRSGGQRGSVTGIRRTKSHTSPGTSKGTPMGPGKRLSQFTAFESPSEAKRKARVSGGHVVMLASGSDLDSPKESDANGGRLERKLSQGSALAAVKNQRISRSKSIDSGVSQLTDEELAQLAKDAQRRRSERRQSRGVNDGVDWISRNKEEAGIRVKTSGQGVTVPPSARLTWTGSDLSHSGSNPTTPVSYHLSGGQSLASTLRSEQHHTPLGEMDRFSMTNSVRSSSLKLPHGVFAVGSVATTDKVEISQQRKKEELARREALVVQRNQRHDPEHVRGKRWFEAITLALVTKHLLEKGLRVKAEAERQAKARRQLTHLFLPVWRCYRLKLRIAAQAVLDRFFMRLVVKKRMTKRNSAIDKIRRFLKQKSHYFSLVVRWYVMIVKKAQRLVRRFLQRRSAQVEANYRKCRVVERDSYWFDAKVKRDRIDAKRKSFTRANALALQGSGGGHHHAVDGRTPTPPDRDLTPPSGTLMVKWDELEPVVREVPAAILRRQIRTLISKKARAWHREEMRRDRIKKGPDGGPLGQRAHSGTNRSPSNNRLTPPAAHDAGEGFLSSSDSASAAPSMRNSTGYERRSSSLRLELDLFKLRKSNHFNFIFPTPECRFVLDESVKVTAELQRDPSWKQHLMNPDAVQLSGVGLGVASPGLAGDSLTSTSFSLNDPIFGAKVREEPY